MRFRSERRITSILTLISALWWEGSSSPLVTIVFNVPRNEALAAVDPTSEEGARLWAGYVPGWTVWNHVRTTAALAAAAALFVSLLL